MFRGHLFDEIEVWRRTFSRQRVHGRFQGLLGAQSRGRDHAPGRLGLHFDRHFSIENRLKIDVDFDIIYDIVFLSNFGFWIKR